MRTVLAVVAGLSIHCGGNVVFDQGGTGEGAQGSGAQGSGTGPIGEGANGPASSSGTGPIGVIGCDELWATYEKAVSAAVVCNPAISSRSATVASLDGITAAARTFSSMRRTQRSPLQRSVPTTTGWPHNVGRSIVTNPAPRPNREAVSQPTATAESAECSAQTELLPLNKLSPRQVDALGAGH